MRLSFLPTAMADAVTDLTPTYLQSLGIRLLMLDFDNTLIPYTTNVPTDEVVHWLEKMKNAQIQLCVVSNSHKDRVKAFCRQYGLDCVTHAAKPFGKGICDSMDRYGFPPGQCALVGDQIFTDTLGANWAGTKSILVKAIHNHTLLLKLRHVAEMPFILAAQKRRIQP